MKKGCPENLVSTSKNKKPSPKEYVLKKRGVGDVKKFSVDTPDSNQTRLLLCIEKGQGGIRGSP